MVSFVRKDYQILTERYRMRRWFYRGKMHALPDRLAIYLGTTMSDFTFSWFGYLQAFWATRYAKQLGKKAVVVLGGFDVCEEEDPSFDGRLPSIRYILRNADSLLAVSERVRTKAIGIEPRANVSLLYHGFDSKRFSPGPKEPIVTTVGFVRQPNLRRKGLEVFVRSAARLPQFRFCLAGKWLDGSIDFLRSIAPPNLEFLGQLSESALIELLQRSAIYVQASLHESFGCSLAEAMLCGCVPVVTHGGAIPEVVGETGIYVNPLDLEDVVRGILEASVAPGKGGIARQRISSLFPLEQRQRQLIQAIEDVLA